MPQAYAFSKTSGVISTLALSRLAMLHLRYRTAASRQSFYLARFRARGGCDLTRGTNIMKASTDRIVPPSPRVPGIVRASECGNCHRQHPDHARVREIAAALSRYHRPRIHRVRA